MCVGAPTEVLLLTISKALSTVALDTCQLIKNNSLVDYTVCAHSGPQS